MAAARCSPDQEVELGNVPDIEDISTMARMLEQVGVAVEHPDTNTWRLHAAALRTTEVDPNLSRRMRGSFLLLGALVARAGEASIAKPGGDDIGMRRVEQHLEGLRLMGAGGRGARGRVRGSRPPPARGAHRPRHADRDRDREPG